MATRGRPHVIRFYNYSDEVMALQARWLKAHGQRRIALLVSDTAYLQEMTLAFKRNLDPSQEIIFEEHILPSETDLRTVLQKAARSGAEIIGAFVSVGQIGTFYRQADAMRIKTPTFGTNWYESQHEIQQAGELIEGASFVSIAATPAFIERYTKAYSNASAMAFAAPAYEFTALLGELFGNLKSVPSADQIMETIASAGFRRGTALEAFRYRETKETGKDFQLPIAVKTIERGKIVELERVNPTLGELTANH